jgi:phage/plasmid-associated DNA primase
MFSVLRGAQSAQLVNKTGPQAMMFEYADHFSQPFRCQYVETRNSHDRVVCGYKYMAFPGLSWVRKFIEQRNKAGKLKCSLFELIPSNYMCRGYFDIDHKLQEPPAHPSSYLIKFAAECKKQLQLLAINRGVPPNKTSIVVKDRSSERPDGSFKVSFHFILPFVLFENNHNGQLKAWATDLNRMLMGTLHTSLRGEHPMEVVDEKVYTFNRLMSCVGTVKPCTDPVGAMTATKMQIHELCYTHALDETENVDNVFAHAWISIPPGTKMENCHLIKDDVLVDYDDDTVVAPTKPQTQAVCHQLPTSEFALAKRWAEKFYFQRVGEFDIPRTDFDCGQIKVVGSKVFMTMPCDRYCQMKRRAHEGDTYGTQTSYEIDLMMGSIRQNCHSCGRLAPEQNIARKSYNMYDLLTTKANDFNIASVMKEEFESAGALHIFPGGGKGASEVVWGWDEHCVGDTNYNLFMKDVKLWRKTGKTDHLTTQIVTPWLMRKFSLLMLQPGIQGSDEKTQKVENARLACLTPHRVAQLKTQFVHFMREYQEDHDVFTSQLNTAELLIATDDNGVVDLTTGVRFDRAKEHMFSIVAPFHLLDVSVPEHNQRVADFHGFVSGIYANKAEKVAYAKKIFGYCLTCNHEDRHIYFHVGCGSNGKTSLDECIQEAIGSFHRMVRSGFLVRKQQKDSSSCSPDIMSVVNARMIVCNETDRGACVDDSRLKLLADGGRMSGRQLYEQERMVNLMGKCMVYSNFMLKMGLGDDLALTDRIVALSYDMRFVSNPTKPNELPRDPKRVAQFKNDPNAVGTWLVQGAVDAMKDIKEHGAIVIPACVQEETAYELQKINILSSFLNDNVKYHSTVLVGGVPSKGGENWTIEKTELWNVFKIYMATFGGGGGDKFDMGMFNGSVQAYLANIRYGVTTEKHGNSYYWVGMKFMEESKAKNNAAPSFQSPFKPAGPDPTDKHFPLFGKKWVNNENE